MGFVIRIALLALIIYYLTRLVKKLLLPHSPASSSNASKKTNNGTIKMVKCQQCHVLFPEEEAISTQGVHFCSTQHLEHWRQKK